MSDQVRGRFEASPEAVREARVFLQNAIAGRVDPEMQSELTLVLSELASNVVRHARTPFEVVVETNGHVRIEVEDGSTDAPVPKAASDEGGRGLDIINRLCDRWGDSSRARRNACGANVTGPIVAPAAQQQGSHLDD
jgi:anti-sigma regulatory factor (Ser/Thr protein kinase)